jgi:undecaprenyl-diphosphatase
MPESSSFPSGHAASAFAFAYAVGRHLPGLAVPIRLLAADVAYLRVEEQRTSSGCRAGAP